MTQQFDPDLVSEFLDNELNHLEPCNLADDPFVNAWHMRDSWRPEARQIILGDREQYAYIPLDQIEAFLDAVSDLADERGYDDGVPKYDDRSAEEREEDEAAQAAADAIVEALRTDAERRERSAAVLEKLRERVRRQAEQK